MGVIKSTLEAPIWTIHREHINRSYEFGLLDITPLVTWHVALKDLPLWDFLGGPVVKNLPSNAEDMSLIPGQGTRPHMLQIN